MKQRIYKLLLIYVVLVAIFALQHPVFIACYHSLFRGVGLGGVCAATWHGLRMDMAMAFAAGYVADRVDRPHLKPSVNTGVVTSVGAFTVAVIAVVSCFVRM